MVMSETQKKIQSKRCFSPCKLSVTMKVVIEKSS